MNKNDDSVEDDTVFNDIVNMIIGKTDDKPSTDTNSSEVASDDAGVNVAAGPTTRATSTTQLAKQALDKSRRESIDAWISKTADPTVEAFDEFMKRPLQEDGLGITNVNTRQIYMQEYKTQLVEKASVNPEVQKLEDELTEYKKTLAKYTRTNHPDRAMIMNIMGDIHTKLGQPKEATRLHEEAQTIRIAEAKRLKLKEKLAEEDMPDDEEDMPDDEEDMPDDEEEEEEEQPGDDKVMQSMLKTGISDEEDTDNDSEDEDALQKLESDIHRDILLQYHPEIEQKNYKEILALCKIMRDVKGVIVDPLHRTLPFITKYERARVLGLRSKQLNTGSDAFIDVPENVIDGLIIAQLELKEKKIPFIVRRPLPNGESEYWKLSDLEDIHY